MRHVDVLQSLMVRLVDPEEEEHDWLLISSLFYSLTKLMLPATRVKELYYHYLQVHGSRPAMEAACKDFSNKLSEKLRQRIESTTTTTTATTLAGIHRSSVSGTSAAVGVLDVTKVSAGAAGGEAGIPVGVLSGSPTVATSVWDESGFCGREAAFRKLTSEQKARWHNLRRELISPDILIDLVQQFTLVDGAAVFLAPVVPSTVMEFNGVRSGPYVTVIHQPLSLMCVKRRVLAARRDYELHKHQSGAYLPTGQNNVGVGSRKRERGNGGVTSRASAVSQPPHFSIATNSGEKGNVIRTLQELEQAVWHITANCVMFNAPESYYPYVARKFALACVAIIDDYCTQRIAGV
ncbi:uncharacterized protein TEOVI_000838300 [Trypanosoma equiperdum]|uniref:Uncharacterized protein n=2 Tax=Trypanozoon TaxID=39700 RepID=C9ZIQ8_TRYB9|nr:hypothetical protein, conserved [Trypanosoma brucei gambiense DAL972]CBH09050.1 hypothetical protein, conserved [Trypanosoma brucei gambiense DAL972]SCU67461.1 hypothetical protein, conserved [Trypanosoma equiperdum]|eukprot:XP_011771491.1 hypothetical protein, conserved [Trypanosoma brucei gambiense DAL972]